MRNSILIPLLVLSVIVSLSFVHRSKSTIEGIWKITSVQMVKPDGTVTTTIPSESQVIFTKHHYSLGWTSNKATVRGWAVSDSVKLARTNQSVINSGTYELTDSVLTTKASFALNPSFTNGIAKFKYHFSKDTLVLRGLSVVSASNVSNPVYAGGTHFVNKLVKVAEIK